jgi:hypothetical protein
VSNLTETVDESVIIVALQAMPKRFARAIRSTPRVRHIDLLALVSYLRELADRIEAMNP